jgi:hypothetical protein
MKTLIVLFIISFGLKAETIPLPASVSGVDEIVSEFRTLLVTKITDLGKNYISTLGNNTIIFTSSAAVNCNGSINQIGERLGSLLYDTKQSAGELSERVVYTGCDSSISLIEDVVTRGRDLLPLPFSDIIKGKRTLELKDNETYRYYKFSNVEGDEIFSVVMEKKETSKQVNYFYLGQKFLSVNFDYQPDSTRAVFTYYGYSGKYVRKHSTWTTRNEFTTFSNTIIAKKNQFVIYLGDAGNAISLSTFMNTFNSTIIDRPAATLGYIFDYHTYYFPKTESTKTGNQSQRFIDELRVAQNRLLTNTEINLVKNLLKDFINAAELGQIIDNRPKAN